MTTQNQPPIPEHMLVDLFPERHSKFLHRKEVLMDLRNSLSKSYYTVKARDLELGTTSPERAILKGQYWTADQEYEDYVSEYFNECTQLIKLGLYEPQLPSIDRVEALASNCRGHSFLEKVLWSLWLELHSKFLLKKQALRDKCEAYKNNYYFVKEQEDYAKN